jgi:hypothetical protein
MTSTYEALERSLRAGPPDEAGYRARPLDLPTATVDQAPTAMAAWAPQRVVPVARVVAARRPDRAPVGSSWRNLAAVLVVAIGLMAAGIVSLANRADVGGRTSSGISVSALTERFASARNGFSISYPAGWTVTPATAAWPRNTSLPNGHPAFDRLELPDVAQLVVASQPLGQGQTEEDWLAAFFQPYPRANPCSSDRSTWPRLQLDGASAYLDVIDCPTSRDHQIAARDMSFEALAFAGGRVYQFRLNGDVDRADFETLLASVRFDPAHAVD